ncbi:hypothetical protein ANO11243_018330 [Dothideomycetidae sp. 11243]|nr:hypothetical protein ANO11243_018330 [fungal sp. No.11243]
MAWLSILKVPVFKNTGSVARDHLTAERTLLAWLRMGLGLIALGTALERFSRIDIEALLSRAGQPHKSPSTISKTPTLFEKRKTSEHLVAMSVLACGSGSIVYGVFRYFSTLSMLGRGLYKPSYLGAGTTGLVAASIAAASIASGMQLHE